MLAARPIVLALARADLSGVAPDNKFVVSLVSSPGSGKTMFLRKNTHCYVKITALLRSSGTSPRKTMPSDWRAARLQSNKITTGTLCHLEAAMVQNALEGWDLNHPDFLFIWGEICAWC